MGTKLSRYSTFEDLKSGGHLHKPSYAKGKKLMSEYEAFLNSLRSEFKIQTKSKEQNGRKIK
jgi:hypothetical protein